MILWLILPMAVVVGALFALAWASRQPPDLGLSEGRLPPCPARPNCVCSEHEHPTAAIAPLVFTDPPEAAWQRAAAAVASLGGTVRETSDDYLWATFTSGVFRFVDDLELRLDRTAGVIHVRSASRVGHSDLGVNRRRVERLRAAFAAAAP